MKKLIYTISTLLVAAALSIPAFALTTTLTLSNPIKFTPAPPPGVAADDWYRQVVMTHHGAETNGGKYNVIFDGVKGDHHKVTFNGLGTVDNTLNGHTVRFCHKTKGGRIDSCSQLYTLKGLK